MKARITRLDLKKDPTFDLEELLDEKESHSHIIETKKHWWNRWKHVMDYHTGFLWYCRSIKLLHDNQPKLK